MHKMTLFFSWGSSPRSVLLIGVLSAERGSSQDRGHPQGRGHKVRPLVEAGPVSVGRTELLTVPCILVFNVQSTMTVISGHAY